MEVIMKIAIDGPAGSGKSTIAKDIAKRLNIIYVDTGAMYRAITLKLLDKKENEYEDILKETKIEFKDGNIYLDDVDVSNKIRTNEISKKTSELSKNPMIRKYLVALQQDMAKKESVVMEGRDIASVVIPDADYKFFLTATPEERAKRRFLQLKEKDNSLTYEEVLKDLKIRDKNDTSREVSPLTKAEDAIVIDSTDLDYEETISKILSYIK
jgi:cytidylate kinase